MVFLLILEKAWIVFNSLNGMKALIYGVGCALSLALQGCVSPRVKSGLDLEESLQVIVLHGPESLRPDFFREWEIVSVLRSTLPQMRDPLGTYPSSLYLLQVTAISPTGEKTEERIFVNHFWVGNGRGVAALSEADSMRLIRAIEETITDPSGETTPGGLWLLPPRLPTESRFNLRTFDRWRAVP